MPVVQSRIVNKGREIYYTQSAFRTLQETVSDYFWGLSGRSNIYCISWASAIRKYVQETSAMNSGYMLNMGEYGILYYYLADYFDSFYGETHHIVVITKFVFSNLNALMNGQRPSIEPSVKKPSIRYRVAQKLPNGLTIANNGERQTVLKDDGTYLYFDGDEQNSWFVKIRVENGGFAVSSDGNDLKYLRYDGSCYSFAGRTWADMESANKNVTYHHNRHGSKRTITESTLRRIIRESLIEYLYN